MLGTVDQGHLFNLLDQLAANDGKSIVAEAEQMAARSFSFEAALQDIAAILHRIALLQTVPATADASQPMHDRLEKLAQTFSPEDVQLYYQIALNGRRDLALAPDEFAGFSMTLMRMLAFRPAGGAQTGQGSGVSHAPAPAPKPSAPAAARVVAPVAATQPLAKTPAPAAQVAVPAMNSVEANTSANVNFNGDWLALVSEIKLGGMAAMLAQHAELKSFEGRKFELVVPEAALDTHFGASVMLKISTGVTSGNSVAVVIEREQQTKQNSAIAAIEQDPFVRELVENMDAKLIESSIKPIA
jgi:DNA polymerase-3 subunit gamma/tau